MKKTSIVTTEEPKESDILAEIDFSEIDRLDPSLVEGHKVCFLKDAPIKVVKDDSNEGNIELLKMKILILGDELNPNQLRIEVTCDKDLFFYHLHEVDEISFKGIQETQKLTLQFKEYLSFIKKMINCCQSDPKNYTATFEKQKNERYRLVFYKNVGFKSLEIIHIEFLPNTNDLIRKQISFRFNSLKSKLILMQDRINTINSILKVKNPSLLLQIQTTPARYVQQPTNTLT